MIWCLHGNLGHASDWDLLSSHPDSPYRGEMIRKVDLWRYLCCDSVPMDKFGAVFAAEVAAQDPNPYLIAYSMGGRLALEALLAAPSLWQGATLISVHPGLASASERLSRQVHDAEWSVKAHQLDWTDFLSEWNQQEVLGPLPSDMADRHLLQPRSAQVARAFNIWSLGLQQDFRTLSTQISCPVQLITGEHDHKFTALASEFNFPNSSHQIIPDTKHRPLWEAPEKTLSVLPPVKSTPPVSGSDTYYAPSSCSTSS